MHGGVSLDFSSLHYKFCEKVGQDFDSATTAQRASSVVTPFHVKPYMSHDKSFVMAILYSLNPAP